MYQSGLQLLAAGFPVADGQFWIVTAIVVIAAAYLLRGVLPIPFLSSRAQKKKRERRATLTVGGRPIDAPRLGPASTAQPDARPREE